MTANADRFPTAIARLTYVVGRLTGKTYELILPKIRFGVPEFLNYPKMLAYCYGLVAEGRHRCARPMPLASART
jgi:hypothetical protein